MAFPKKKVFLAVIIIAVVASGAYVLKYSGTESTDDAAFEAPVVTISPRVGGYITKLAVTDNQVTKAGDVIAEIDPRDYQIALDKARATLKAATARQAASTTTAASTRVSAPKELEAAAAQVNLAQATYDNAAITLKRLRALNDTARSKQQLDDAIASESRALAALNDAQAKLATAGTAPNTIAAAQSTADSVSAEVEQAAADVAQAEKNLADTKIIAPFDGKITSRGVEQGDYVQAGQNMLSLVSPHVWVVANFKETQLRDMRIGQKVDMHVDAYPALKLSGHIESIQSGSGGRFSAFPPQNATGNFVKIVQRVPVKIVIDGDLPPDVVLGPGMSVVPRVDTKG